MCFRMCSRSVWEVFGKREEAIKNFRRNGLDKTHGRMYWPKMARLDTYARLSARKASILQSSRKLKLSFAPKRAKLRANAQKRRA